MPEPAAGDEEAQGAEQGDADGDADEGGVVEPVAAAPRVVLDDQVYERAPDRFMHEIVVAVLRDIGVDIANARQRITVAYADFDLAKALGIKVNSAVFKVLREFFDKHGGLIYSAKLFYPCDLLELEIEFSTDNPA